MKSTEVVVGKVYAVAYHGRAASSGRGSIDGKWDPCLKKAEVLGPGSKSGHHSWQTIRGFTVRWEDGREEVVRAHSIGCPWEEYEALAKEDMKREARAERDHERAVKFCAKTVELFRARGIDLLEHGGYETEVTFEGKALRQLYAILKVKP